MNQTCIYLQKSDLHYKKREHIVPAFLGGLMTLEQGVVSDEMNEAFSKLECRVSRESILTMQRMFYGPGKRGSANPKKQGHHKIAIVSTEQGEVSLGYLYMGKPKHITQIYLPLDLPKQGSYQVNMSVDADFREDPYKEQKRFWDHLSQYAQPIVLQDDVVPEHMALLGEVNGKWYLGLHTDTQECREKVERLVHALTAPGTRPVHVSAAQSRQAQVHMNYSYQMDLNAYFRVIAKTAFNTAAYLNGAEYMHQECFDDIRQAIVTGEGIGRFVHFTEDDRSLQVLKKLEYDKKFGKELHVIVCFRMEHVYTALVYFYGIERPMMVILSEKIEGNMPCPHDMFICDWQNRKEYRLGEFLGKLLTDEET